MNLPSKIIVSCPRCDWRPNSNLFFELKLYRYKLNKNDLVYCSCFLDACKNSAPILDWINLVN